MLCSWSRNTKHAPRQATLTLLCKVTSPSARLHSWIQKMFTDKITVHFIILFMWEKTLRFQRLLWEKCRNMSCCSTYWMNGPLLFCLTRIPWRRLYSAVSKLQLHATETQTIATKKVRVCVRFIKSSKIPARMTRILQSLWKDVLESSPGCEEGEGMGGGTVLAAQAEIYMH